jgi:squalene-hopene/tetraprenyl-beta-curcumene cyclase
MKKLLLAGVVVSAVLAPSLRAQDRMEQENAALKAQNRELQGNLNAEKTQQKLQAAIDKGLEYLKSQQKPDGGWAGEKEPPAFTALVLRTLVKDLRYSTKDDFIKKGYDKLLTYQLEDGGIYKNLQANYSTAVAVSALAAANDPAYKPQLDKAIAYLRSLQWTPDTKPEYVDTDNKEKATGKQLVKDDKDVFFGGWGYGGNRDVTGNGRPDLSNAQMAMDALKDAGLKPEDPAFQNALKFVTRLQNHSETNDQSWAGNDGGFVYSPGVDKKGESMAGSFTTPEGKPGLRSYGSMTYAGLKSFIYAGLSKDDPRVKAAWDWITKNWTLDENPGMKAGDPKQAQSGLYYYYHTLARALHEYGEPVITDTAGNKHDWRVELVDKLAAFQKEDGSWVGDKRWMEQIPVLTTTYAVQALQEVQADLKKNPVK